MEKKYSEAFSQLVEKFPEALGVPVFVVDQTGDETNYGEEEVRRVLYNAVAAAGGEVPWAVGGDGAPTVCLNGVSVGVTELLPQKFVLLITAGEFCAAQLIEPKQSESKIAFAILRAGSNVPYVACALDKNCGSFVGGFADDKIKDAYRHAMWVELYECVLVLAAYISGGELVEAKPTLSRAASALKRRPVYKLSYTTVHLPGVKTERKTHQGGTHASPRQHERRGHWRTYRSGKRVWVKNCVVGDPSLGHVKHAYVVAQGETS